MVVGRPPQKAVHHEGKFDGARERTRTSTTLRSLAPEASASASSATRARVLRVKPRRRRDFSSNEAFLLCPRLAALSTKAALDVDGKKLEALCYSHCVTNNREIRPMALGDSRCKKRVRLRPTQLFMHGFVQWQVVEIQMVSAILGFRTRSFTFLAHAPTRTARSPSGRSLWRDLPGPSFMF
jgi:hypothetical protein